MKRIFLPKKYANKEKLLKDFKGENPVHLAHRAEARALELFHGMARQVPAYRNFLRKEHISALKVKTFDDFKKIPTLNKDNYLRAYPLEALCWDGEFKKRRWTIASTSGSTGKPFYFPREKSQDMQYVETAELYLKTNFHIHKKSTLYIDAFPLGPWIGGIFTYEAITTVAERGDYPLSIITTGVDKKEIINAVRNFGDRFDQIIIGCYAPFLKDALDDGVREGLDWSRYNIKFIFSAEGFSERFRDYVGKIAGLKNIYRDTLNHYGTVDQGTLAYETPLAILIRRQALENEKLYHSIFPVEHKLPTLCQYDPELFFFEAQESRLLCSSYSGLPLVRYDLKDNGGVIRYETMMDKTAAAGLSCRALCRKAGIADTVWKLPFVFVYERSDFSASLYAFQVYPETIRKALQEEKHLASVTGKFSMITRYNRNSDQYLEINIELQGRTSASKKLESDLARSIIALLHKENSEFRKTHEEIGARIHPRVVLWPYEHPTYFRPGGKQKWVIEEKKE